MNNKMLIQLNEKKDKYKIQINLNKSLLDLNEDYFEDFVNNTLYNLYLIINVLRNENIEEMVEFQNE